MTTEESQGMDQRSCRRELMARLAAERAGLMEGLLGLDERALREPRSLGEWSVQDVLAHIAAWERWEMRSMGSMVAGETPDLAAAGDFDGANAAFIAPWRDRALDEVVSEVCSARAEWVAWLEGLPDKEFSRPRSYHGWDWTFSDIPLRVQWEHDAHHAQRIAAWRKGRGAEGGSGPKRVLLAALDAAREELMRSAALVPIEERATRRVCGEWTLKDVLGHIADWEWLGAEGLSHMAAGRSPRVEHVEDIDAWNRAHAQARRDEPWEEVWVDWNAAHDAFRDALRTVSENDLVRVYRFPWDRDGTPYGWVSIFVDHDRAHARGLRRALADDRSR
jgi:uncharacterized damage-inducible protein DinB